MSIVVAAGPFTTSADLEFEPLQELLRACKALQGGPPAALLLAGPFLDASHELVANGQLEQPFQRVFEQQASVHLPSCHTNSSAILLLKSSLKLVANRQLEKPFQHLFEQQVGTGFPASLQAYNAHCSH